MIRFALFSVLGPLIGFLVFILLGGGFKSHAEESFAILLPFAFLAGFIPALAVAALDRMFESRGATSLQRCLFAGLAGVCGRASSKGNVELVAISENVRKANARPH
jgi:hypothetical protein